MSPATMSDGRDKSPTSSSILKERRFKLSRACDRCRIKCDEGHPCQACLTASSACTFEEPGKRTHPHKSKRTATLEDRMHHLETLIQAIPPAVFAAGGVSTTNSAAPPEAASSPIAPFMYPTQFPSGVPPPSLHVFPLAGPSAHFGHDPKHDDKQHSPNAVFGTLLGSSFGDQATTPDQLAEETSRMSLSASYLYFDDEGYTRWQGETSGLPVLDLLVERHTPSTTQDRNEPTSPAPHASDKAASATNTAWFPNRTPRRTDINPQTLWRLITTFIVPELMDNLVQCYLSTSYYILPFLHVPTFLSDYGNPQKWGEPGFAAFIVSICCLASRHMDDSRVRASSGESISAGTHWFELFGRLRTLPIADRPTLYNIQANLIAAVYAVGLGKLSKAAALLAESVTIRYLRPFRPIEDEVRKRTFWCVYIWDKQLSAHFGRPTMIRLRDCDVSEPASIDDEFITRDGMGIPPPGTESRMSAFICSLRIMVVLESVLDVPPTRQYSDSSSFLLRATSALSGGKPLDEIHRSIPTYWAHTPETLATDDTIRLTQAERLHCAEQFVRLLIYRHRFSELLAERTNESGEEEQTDKEKDAMIAAHSSALEIITTHLHIAKKGLMTYYGVHVIHQLTQAGRTLVAILLCCKTEALQHLIPTGLDALRSCVGLLRRFSGRYLCGLRSGDLMEEFCRLTQIPLEPIRQETPQSNARPPWIRPVRKKAPSAPRSSQSGDSPPPHHSSPEGFSPEFFTEPQGAGSFPASATPIANDFGRRIGTSGSSFMDTGMDVSDDQMYMSPAEMMALLGRNGWW
ncbi:fungal-specific transcription factor domain-containing protein [Infundibulicybe gibba]|nr:fungal-specific transcription factor domain-containing protein [Infundibulicybe gibba]